MATDESKLFVAGLPDSISEDALKGLFEATGGKVVGVSLPKDRMTGRPRGFGFVTLATPQEAQAARDALDGSLQGGKSISVRPFQAEPPRRDGPGGPRMGGGPGGPRGPGGGPPPPDRTLYVGNLPYDATQEEVQTLVNSVTPDSVVRVHLPMDADGRKRGFGFVTLNSSEAAKTASEKLQGADLRTRRLVVNLAHPKGDRPARPEGGGFASPNFGPPPFGGGGPGGGASGAPPRKGFEEKRKRTFDDGGGPRKKAKERGGANKFNYPDDDD
jgi:RNA recognition motif-containing protein